MSVTPQEAEKVHKQADRLYDMSQIEQALDSMAAQITENLQYQNPLALCVMIGGVMTTGALLSRLSFPLEMDYIHATRYRGKTSGGEIRWLARPVKEIRGRNILLVDDILDEGHTLVSIRDACLDAGASSVEVAVLVEKLHDRKADIRADYCGLEVPDRYVYGFGMDYKEYLRNAAGIYAVNENG